MKIKKMLQCHINTWQRDIVVGEETPEIARVAGFWGHSSAGSLHLLQCVCARAACTAVHLEHQVITWGEFLNLSDCLRR